MLPDMVAQWNHMKACALSQPSLATSDGVSWSLNGNGRFSTKSIYQYLKKKNLLIHIINGSKKHKLT
jgi:hypothetical protein